MKEINDKDLQDRKLKMLGEQVRSFRKRSQISIKKRIKLNRVNQNLAKENRMGKAIEKLYLRDDDDLQKQLSESDELLSTFRRTVYHKKDRFQHQHEALRDLEGNIQGRTSEVHNKIKKLEEAILEWQTANFIINDNCRVANYFAAERFHNWHQTIPLLQTWLASEEKIHQCIYSSASFAGLFEELQAYHDVKEQIQDYADTLYKDITAVKLIPPLKQINEQRQMRSEAFDQLHLKIMKQLRSYVRQCDNIHAEIQEREQIRARLNSIVMELNGALEEDLSQSLFFCEEEARRPMEHILEGFKRYSADERKIISRTYVYLANSLNSSFFSNLNNETNIIYRNHHSHVLNEMDFYESESIINANQPKFTENIDQGSVVSDLSDSLCVDSRSIREPIGIAAVKQKLNGQGQADNEQGDYKVNDSNEVIAQFREQFDAIKRRLTASRTKKCIKNAMPEIGRCLDQIAPNLKNNWKLLQDISVDFEARDSVNQTALLKRRYEDRTPLENLLHAQYILKDIQHQCAGGAYDSICTVSNLLKRIKEKNELTRFLRSDDSFSQPLGYYKPHSSDPLCKKEEDGNEIERKEYMTAQQLISRVSDTISKNKLVFENWMVEVIGSRYEQNKNRLTQELSRLQLVDPKEIAQNEIEILETSFQEQNTGVETNALQTLIAGTITSDSNRPASNQSKSMGEEIDETETSIQNLLSKSEQVLSSLNKMKINAASIGPTATQSGTVGKRVDSPSINVDGDLVPAEVISSSHTKQGFRPFYTLSEDEYEREENDAFKKINGQNMSGPGTATSDRRISHLQPDTNHPRGNSEDLACGFREDYDRELVKVEILMKGDLFSMTLFWKASAKEILLVMRHVFDRNGYKEYKMHLNLPTLCELTEMQGETLFSHIFTDTSKLCQHISCGLQIEVIDNSFYSEISGRLIVDNVQIEGDSDIDIKMYLPFRKDRRASVLQQHQEGGPLKRQSFASGFSQGTYIASRSTEIGGSSQGQRRIVAPAVELPYSYLLKVLTLRAKTGVLMRHSFPRLYSVEN